MVTAPKRTCHGKLAEFPVVLFVLLLLCLFPLLDLLSVAAAAGTGYLAANQTASQVAVQQTYAKSLTTMQSELSDFLSNGFGAWLRMKPVAGYNRCGGNLSTIVTNFRQQGATTFGPNTPVPGPIDPTTYLYECSVQVTVQVPPLVNLSSLPFLAQVQGLGQPAVLTFVANRLSEHPYGLCNPLDNLASLNTPVVGSIGIPFDSAMNPQAGASGWNFPGIYNQIAGTGATATDEDVLIVDAKDPYWITSVLSSQPGDTLYLDYHAYGNWQFPSMNFCTPDGLGTQAGNGYPVGSMLAKQGNGQPFFVGANETCVLTGSGPLKLAANCGSGPMDNPALNPDQSVEATTGPYAVNGGAVIARVILSRR
jgi:hypothetical protein